MSLEKLESLIKFQEFMDELQSFIPKQQYQRIEILWNYLRYDLRIGPPLLESFNESIQMVWQNDQAYLEIEVEKDGQGIWLYSLRSGHYEEGELPEGGGISEELVGAFRQFVRG